MSAAVQPLWFYNADARGLVFVDPQTGRAQGWLVRLVEQMGWNPQNGTMELGLRKVLPPIETPQGHGPTGPTHPLLRKA